MVTRQNTRPETVVVSGVSLQSRCHRCDAGDAPMKRETLLGQQMTHLEGHSVVRSFLCSNFDMNCRIAGEELGFYKFAWLPKKCRNGFRVWLKWVECRRDGTFTLGDRAHD